jgi:hypothetical protein
LTFSRLSSEVFLFASHVARSEFTRPSSPGVQLSFRVHPKVPSLAQKGSRPPPMEFLPLQRIQLEESTRPGLASPGTFRLQGSLTLLAVCSSSSLPALFHAGNAHGVSPFRGFPSQGAAPPHQRSVTLLTFFPASCLQPRSAGDGRPLPRHLGFREGPFNRLQGFYLPKSPFSSANTFKSRRRPIPSWASSFPRSTPQRGCNGFRRRSSRVLQPTSLRKASFPAVHRPAPQSISPRHGRLPSDEGSRPQ